MKETTRTTAYGRIRAVAGLVMLAASMLLTACGSSRQAATGESLRVYYLNKDQTTIVSESYLPDADLLREDRAGDLVAELLERLSAPEDGANHTAAIREDMVDGWDIADGVLTLSMTSDYGRMSGTKEILVRAALVNTLCDVRGVNGVSIMVDGAAIKDADGNEIGGQTAEDYIFSSDNELRAYEKVRLHLYFADARGTRLIDTYRTVVYNSNVAQERLVVEEVLKGPNTDVVYPTIDGNTQILSVTTRDGICYVNLDRNFLTDPYDVTSQVAVYSLVNALTELSTVDAVQISVEGSTSESFMDISLQDVFRRDLSMVGTTE